MRDTSYEMMGAAEGGGAGQTRSRPTPPLGRRSSHTRRPTVGQGGSWGGKENHTPRGAGGGRTPPSPDGAIIQTGKRGEGGGGPRLLPPPPTPPPECLAPRRGPALSHLPRHGQTRPREKKNTDRCYTGYPPVPDTPPSSSLPHPLCWRLLIPHPPPSIHAPPAPHPPDSPAHPPLRNSGKRGVGALIENCTGPLKARLNKVIPVSRGGKDM